MILININLNLYYFKKQEVFYNPNKNIINIKSLKYKIK